jgi:membrane-bound lytic murein transglycosylase B
MSLSANSTSAALHILARGDLPLRDLVGAYAGEIGQTQFLPSSYIKYGVDLRHSVAARQLASPPIWNAFGPGTGNFEMMREWNHAEIYRRRSVRSGTARCGGSHARA